MFVVYCCRYRPLRQRDHSFRGVLAAVCVRLRVCVLFRNLKTRRPKPDLGRCTTEKKIRNLRSDDKIFLSENVLGLLVTHQLSPAKR